MTTISEGLITHQVDWVKPPPLRYRISRPRTPEDIEINAMLERELHGLRQDDIDLARRLINETLPRI